MLRHTIAFLILLVVFLAAPALADPAGPKESAVSKNEGVRGHTILRTYGAVVPEGWGDEGDDGGPGWGVGMSLGYGVARDVLITGGFAHYQVDDVGSRRGNSVVQLGVGVEAGPARGVVRPWLGAGVAIYRMDPRGDPIVRIVPASTSEGTAGSSGSRFGVSWGAGLAVRLSQNLGLDTGARYHHSFGDPILSGRNFTDEVHLLDLQLGLSYVLR